MRTILAFGLLAAWAASAAEAASAEDWRLLITDEEEDWGRSLGFIDVASIERAGNDLRFRVDFRLERPPATADGLRARIRADCATRHYESSDGFYFVGDRQIGPADPEPAQSAEPGTNMHVLLGNACEGRYLSGNVDPVAYARAYFARE